MAFRPETLFVINQLRSQPAITKADNCQLTTANKTQQGKNCKFKIQSESTKKEGVKREHTKQTDTNWIKQLKRHNMLFCNWLASMKHKRSIGII